jgi:hypothetical protein
MAPKTWLWLAAVALIGAWPSSATAAPAGAGAASKDKVEVTGVYRFVGGQDSGSMGGMNFEALMWAPAAGGAPFKVLGPRGFLAKLTPGKLYEIKMDKSADPKVANPPQIHEQPKEYPMKPGEDLPGVYFFQSVVSEEVGGQKRTGLEVSKFGQTTKVWLPNIKDENHQSIPDPRMLEKANGLKKDDAVKIDIASGAVPTVKSFAPFAAPREGEFVEATTVKVGDQDLVAATIKAGSETITAAVAAGKAGSDAKLTALVKHLKAGQAVLFSVHKEGEQAWLDDIKAAEKKTEPAAKKPA